MMRKLVVEEWLWPAAMMMNIAVQLSAWYKTCSAQALIGSHQLRKPVAFLGTSTKQEMNCAKCWQESDRFILQRPRAGVCSCRAWFMPRFELTNHT